MRNGRAELAYRGHARGSVQLEASQGRLFFGSAPAAVLHQEGTDRDGLQTHEAEPDEHLAAVIPPDRRRTVGEIASFGQCIHVQAERFQAPNVCRATRGSRRTMSPPREPRRAGWRPRLGGTPAVFSKSSIEPAMRPCSK